MIYKQCYLPSILYPLPASSIPILDIDKMQTKILSTLLSKMGYSWSFPCSVVFAPSKLSGLGLWHIAYKQETQKILFLIKHIWHVSHHGKMLHILIDAYQLCMGISQPILENTQTLLWTPYGWLTSLCQFMHTHCIKIKIQNSWTLPHQWQHDCHIMDDIAMLSITPLEMQCINNVCLFLQINMLSVWNHGSHWLLTTTNSIWCSRHQQWFEVWVRFHPSMALLIVPWLDCLEKWQAVLRQLYLHTNLLKLCTPDHGTKMVLILAVEMVTMSPNQSPIWTTDQEMVHIHTAHQMPNLCKVHPKWSVPHGTPKIFLPSHNHPSWVSTQTHPNIFPYHGLHETSPTNQPYSKTLPTHIPDYSRPDLVHAPMGSNPSTSTAQYATAGPGKRNTFSHCEWCCHDHTLHTYTMARWRCHTWTWGGCTLHPVRGIWYPHCLTVSLPIPITYSYQHL